MKLKILLLSLSFSIFTFGQKELYIEYETQIVSKKIFSTLIVEKTKAVYEEGGKGNPAEFYENGGVVEELGSNAYVVGGTTHTKIYKNLENQNVLEIILFKNEDPYLALDKNHFITDSIPELHWKIDESGKTKLIHGYACKEATVEFRGSTFLAYFTTEIPTSFGPWKFDGLPGLILKISSLDNPTIFWEAQRVIYPYTAKKEESKNEPGIVLTMEEYIKQKDELSVRRAKTFAAQQGSAYHPISYKNKREKTRERKYEWETW